MAEEAKGVIPLTLEDADTGNSVTTMLTPDAADSLGVQLMAMAGQQRGIDPRPIHEQPKFIEVNEPQWSVRYERDPENGKESIGLVFKANDHRPMWLWFDKENAVDLARMILTLSAGRSERAN